MWVEHRKTRRHVTVHEHFAEDQFRRSELDSL